MTAGDFGDQRSSLDDLVTWLARHGVAAQSEINNTEGYVDLMETTALGRSADLVVTGGYGHSWFREWLLGGMTRRLLEANSPNRLLSN